jgi:hypothetical protein
LLLGCKPSGLYRHHAKGLKFSKPGQRAVYLLEDIMAYLELAREKAKWQGYLRGLHRSSTSLGCARCRMALPLGREISLLLELRCVQLSSAHHDSSPVPGLRRGASLP